MVEGSLSSLEVYSLSIDEVAPPPAAVRSVMDEDALFELSASIKEVGILNPIIVRKIEKGYEIVAGHRRYLAARGAGLAELRCIVLESNEAGEDLARFHENAHREAVNPVDEGMLFSKMMERYQWSPAQVAEKSGKSSTYVYERLALLNMDVELKEAVRLGTIALGVARELSRIPDEHYRKSLADVAVRSGVSVRQAKGWRIEHERISKGIVLEAVPDSGQGELVEVKEFNLPCASCLGEVDANSLSSLLLCPGCWDAVHAGLRVSREVPAPAPAPAEASESPQ